MARDEPAAERVHRDDADVVPQRGLKRLPSEGEIQRVVADGDAFKKSGGEHVGVVGAAEVRGYDQVLDEPFLLRALGRGDRSFVEAFLKLARLEQAPDVEEIDVIDAQSPEGFFEAGPQGVVGGRHAFGGNVKRVARQGLESPAEDLLTLVVAIEGSGIEIVDALRVSVADQFGRAVEIGRLREAHAAKSDDRDVFSCFAVRFGPHGEKGFA